MAGKPVNVANIYLRIQLQGNPLAKTYPFLGHALSQNVRSNQFNFVL